MSERMYDDGYTNNYNIDICENVIEFMKERCKDRKGMVFETMDVKNLSYKDETFDLIIDKSTIDALLCGEHSFMNVATMTKEMSRVLKTGGIYLVISYGDPESRMPHLEREHLGFDINIYTIKKEEDKEEQPRNKSHYVYICKKMECANENLKNYDLVYKDLEQNELEDSYGEEEEEEENEDVKEEQPVINKDSTKTKKSEK